MPFSHLSSQVTNWRFAPHIASWTLPFIREIRKNYQHPLFGTSYSTFFKICDSELYGKRCLSLPSCWAEKVRETEEGQAKVPLFFVKTYSQVVSETTLPSSVQDWFKRRFREKSEKWSNFFKKQEYFCSMKITWHSRAYHTTGKIFTLDIFWYLHQGTFVWLKVWWKWREIFAVKQVLVLFLPGGILIL